MSGTLGKGHRIPSVAGFEPLLVPVDAAVAPPEDGVRLVLAPPAPAVAAPVPPAAPMFVPIPGSSAHAYTSVCSAESQLLAGQGYSSSPLTSLHRESAQQIEMAVPVFAHERPVSLQSMGALEVAALPETPPHDPEVPPVVPVAPPARPEACP